MTNGNSNLAEQPTLKEAIAAWQKSSTTLRKSVKDLLVTLREGRI